MTQETSKRATAATVADLMQRIEDSWRAFLTSLDDLTEDDLLESNAVGEWSLKELLGHIAFWDDLGRENAALALSGQAREFDDFEALNQTDHASRQGRSLAEERAAMHQAHAALVADLEERAELDASAIDAAIAGFHVRALRRAHLRCPWLAREARGLGAGTVRRCNPLNRRHG